MGVTAFSNKFIRPLALALVAFVAAGSPSFSQATNPGGAVVGAQHLYINILEGEGALNNIRQRDAREPVVQVTDENHKPVAGVALLFLIHDGASGGSATFGGTSASLGTTTNAQGLARAVGLQVGKQPGSYTISVSASLGTLTATAVIHQATVLSALSTTTTASTSAASGGGGSSSGVTSTIVHHGILHLGKTALITTGAVTAAVAAVVVTAVVTNNNESTSVTLGSSTVGAPH